MTVEQQQYGGGWERCTACGVKDRVDQLEKVDGKVQHKRDRAAKCAEWKRTLQLATVADIDLVAKRADEVLAEVHKPDAPIGVVTVVAFPPRKGDPKP